MDIDALLSLIDEESNKRHTIFGLTCMKWQIEEEVKNATDRDVCYSLMETKNSLQKTTSAAIEDYDPIYNKIQMIIQDFTGGNNERNS